jgi:diacylglycerol kinase (ATP)
MEAVLIVNTRSRLGQEQYVQVQRILRDAGVNLTQSCEFRRMDALIAKTKEVTTKGVPLIIIGGGDGTLSAVARCFVGSRSTLGVVPLGTGNQFARDLGIATEMEIACKVLIEGKPAEVDLGIAGENYFLNVATVGLTTRIAEELTVESKRRLGRFVYALALAQAMRKVRPFCATLSMPDGERTFNTLQIVIGNGRFHAGPFPLSPEATITDGKLSGYALATTSRWALLKCALRLPGGHQVELEDVTAFSTPEVTLQTSPPQRVTVDGEILFRTPIHLGIAPKALRVMVPQDFGKVVAPALP